MRFLSEYDVDAEPDHLPKLGVGTHKVEVAVPAGLLKPGCYCLSVGADLKQTAVLTLAERVFQIDVVEIESDVLPERAGRAGTVAPVLN